MKVGFIVLIESLSSTEMISFKPQIGFYISFLIYILRYSKYSLFFEEVLVRITTYHYKHMVCYYRLIYYKYQRLNLISNCGFSLKQTIMSCVMNNQNIICYLILSDKILNQVVDLF